jgi:hypothetical protein
MPCCDFSGRAMCLLPLVRHPLLQVLIDQDIISKKIACWIQPTMSMSFSSTCKPTWKTRGTLFKLKFFYSFIFTLQEFAKELISLVDIIERIYCYERQILFRDSWWIRLFTRIKHGFVTLFNITKYNKNMGIRKRLCMFSFTDILGE